MTDRRDSYGVVATPRLVGSRDELRELHVASA
jgi:hypothetical protein